MVAINSHLTTTTFPGQAGIASLQTDLLEEIWRKKTTKGRDIYDDLWTETGDGDRHKDEQSRLPSPYRSYSRSPRRSSNSQIVTTIKRAQTRSIAFSFPVCIIQTQTIVENISTKRTNIRNRVIVGRGRIKEGPVLLHFALQKRRMQCLVQNGKT